MRRLTRNLSAADFTEKMDAMTPALRAAIDTSERLQRLPVIRGHRRYLAAVHFEPARLMGPFRIPVALEITSKVLNHFRSETLGAILLHEWAHAIAGYDADHNPDWARVAKAIGCPYGLLASKPIPGTHIWQAILDDMVRAKRVTR